MNDPKRGYIRKIYYIKKDFQKKFIIEYTTIVMTGAIFAIGVLYLLTRKMLFDNFYRAHISLSTTADITNPPLLITGAMIGVTSILVIIAASSFTSWRTGNRLLCLWKGINGLMNADLTIRVDLPYIDGMSEVAEILNNSIKNLNDKVVVIRTKVEEMEEAFHEIHVDREGTIGSVLERTSEIEKELSFFKLRT